MDENPLFGAGFGLTVLTFFGRYAVKEMPPWVARLGVAIGLLMMLSSATSTRPSLTSGPFVLFLVGCVCIAGSIFWELSRPVPKDERPDRYLSDAQKRSLTTEASKIRQMMPSIMIVHVNGDPESEAFSKDFIDTFRRAGIQASYGWTALDGPDQVGVLIAVPDPQNPPIATARLHDALKAIGIETNTVSIPRAGLGSVATPPPFALYVAPRPL